MKTEAWRVNNKLHLTLSRWQTGYCQPELINEEFSFPISYIGHRNLIPAIAT